MARLRFYPFIQRAKHASKKDKQFVHIFVSKKKMEENVIDKVDRISRLPDPVVHHILSFLHSPKTLVRMSVLSKDWFSLTASFPILKFDIRTIPLLVRKDPFDDDYKYVRGTFFKHVAYTTSRFCEQNVSGHTFSIVTDPLELGEVVILERCLGLILKKGVRVLVFHVNYASFLPMYCLPNILLSASSLTSLTVHGCKLPSSLTPNDVKFNSLKLLSLCWVSIDEGVIKCLTLSCPLLEEINLKNCYGFKRFCVSGLPNLKKVQIYCKNEIELVDIKAPNMCYLLLDNYKGRGVPYMNLALCKKLTTFRYHGLLSKSFTDFLSNFPFIENLFLRLPYHYDNLKLSSRSLRRLELRSNCDLEKVDIDTPNLLLFDCCGDSLWFYPREKKELKACMKYDSSTLVDTLWFQKLRRFLDRSNGFKVLKLVIEANFIDVKELKAIQMPPYELKHVELELGYIKELSVLLAVVDAVLWCCRPRSLTIGFDGFVTNSNYETRSRVVKYTYEKLHRQEDQDQINIEIVLCFFSGAKQHFSDLSLMLKALPDDQESHTITSIKDVNLDISRCYAT